MLEGNEAVRVLDFLDSIAASLAPSRPSPDGPASLATGDCGLALFYGNLALLTENDAYADRAEEFLSQAIKWAAESPFDASLYGGHTGIAWVVEQFQNRLFEPTGDPNEEIDDALEEVLSVSSWPALYDLIGGLVGVGVYCLERLPNQRTRKLLDILLERLRELSEQHSEGRTWFTPPHLITSLDPDRAQHEGYFNLGMAHGVPGVVSLLAMAAVQAGSANAAHLLEQATPWLLGRRGSGAPHSAYAYFVGAEYKSESVYPPARFAWCYGDPGVGVALLWSAMALRQESWHQAALEILRDCAGRSRENTGIQNPGLCHGAAGIGHLLNRVYQVSGEEVFAVTARDWFFLAMDMLATQKPCRVTGREDSVGFLTGFAGAGLALISAVSSDPPRWDRALLLSPP